MVYCMCKWNFPTFQHQLESLRGSSQWATFICGVISSISSNVLSWLETHSWVSWVFVACLNYSQFHFRYPGLLCTPKHGYPSGNYQYHSQDHFIYGVGFLSRGSIPENKQPKGFALSKSMTREYPNKVGALDSQIRESGKQEPVFVWVLFCWTPRAPSALKSTFSCPSFKAMFGKDWGFLGSGYSDPEQWSPPSRSQDPHKQGILMPSSRAPFVSTFAFYISPFSGLINKSQAQVLAAP